ncbi:variable surface lipoprotein [Mycoplasmopsis agalactiae]|uniref:variable surface lipoprotein n=1 Tax=Mycoplasmopsis agalactiae TaxID=2110 RepID=UPI00211CBCC8|nr:variable surface lipoprotein [Mycoplasmopsis agalactiae]UUM25489.1 variable surface lipoprotein [Mycoplasmopsis agalactiae]
MKKSKFLLLGSVSSLAAIPFVAAKCGETKSEEEKKPEVDKKPGEDKNPGDENANPGKNPGGNNNSVPNNPDSTTKTDISKLKENEKAELSKTLSKEFTENPSKDNIANALKKYFKDIKPENILVRGSEKTLKISATGSNSNPYSGTLELMKRDSSSSVTTAKTDISKLKENEKAELSKTLSKEFTENPSKDNIANALKKYFKDIKPENILVRGSEKHLKISATGSNSNPYSGTLELMKRDSSSSVTTAKTDISKLKENEKAELSKTLSKEFTENPSKDNIANALKKYFKDIKPENILVRGSEKTLKISATGSNSNPYSGTLELMKRDSSSSVTTAKTDISKLKENEKAELSKTLSKEFTENPSKDNIANALKKYFKDIKPENILVRGSEKTLKISATGSNSNPYSGTLELMKEIAVSSVTTAKTDISKLKENKKAELSKTLSKEFTENPSKDNIANALKKYFKDIKPENILVRGSEKTLKISATGSNSNPFTGTLLLSSMS